MMTIKHRLIKNSGTTPETLTHLNHERIAGLLIGRDTPKARELARQYAKDLSELTQKPVPIVFYDSIAQTARPYIQQEQLNDALSLRLKKPYNLSMEQNAKEILYQLKERLLAKKDWRLHGFFAGTSYQDRRLTSTTAFILNLIEKAELAEASNYKPSTLTWVDTKKTVLNRLVGATTTKLGRDSDSIAFNQQLIQAAFSDEERLFFGYTK